MTTEKDEEARALRKRFEGVNQREFLRTHNLKVSPSMLGQNLSGHRPISLKTALELAGAFGCSISEISPRIAKKLQDARGVEIGSVPAERPDLTTSLRVIADAFAAISPAARATAAENLILVVRDPAAHANDQIPIIVRKLSQESADSGVANAAAPEHQEELDRLSREAEEQHVNSAKRRRVSGT